MSSSFAPTVLKSDSWNANLQRGMCNIIHRRNDLSIWDPNRMTIVSCECLEMQGCNCVCPSDYNLLLEWLPNEDRPPKPEQIRFAIAHFLLVFLLLQTEIIQGRERVVKAHITAAVIARGLLLRRIASHGVQCCIDHKQGDPTTTTQNVCVVSAH